jgi:hypothetical protein
VYSNSHFINPVTLNFTPVPARKDTSGHLHAEIQNNSKQHAETGTIYVLDDKKVYTILEIISFHSERRQIGLTGP